MNQQQHNHRLRMDRSLSHFMDDRSLVKRAAKPLMRKTIDPRLHRRPYVSNASSEASVDLRLHRPPYFSNASSEASVDLRLHRRPYCSNASSEASGEENY